MLSTRYARVLFLVFWWVCACSSLTFIAQSITIVLNHRGKERTLPALYLSAETKHWQSCFYSVCLFVVSEWQLTCNSNYLVFLYQFDMKCLILAQFSKCIKQSSFSFPRFVSLVLCFLLTCNLVGVESLKLWEVLCSHHWLNKISDPLYMLTGWQEQNLATSSRGCITQ